MQKWKKIEYDLAVAEMENRERIDALFSYDAAKALAEAGEDFHEKWMIWKGEIWHRLNWMTHQNFYRGVIRSYLAGDYVPDSNDIAWTLDDYVYGQ